MPDSYLGWAIAGFIFGITFTLGARLVNGVISLIGGSRAA